MCFFFVLTLFLFFLSSQLFSAERKLLATLTKTYHLVDAQHDDLGQRRQRRPQKILYNLCLLIFYRPLMTRTLGSSTAKTTTHTQTQTSAQSPTHLKQTAKAFKYRIQDTYLALPLVAILVLKHSFHCSIKQAIFGQ